MTRQPVGRLPANAVNALMQPFPTRILVASLNLSTYIALYSYGYRNVYELAPQLDIASSRLEFESSVR